MAAAESLGIPDGEPLKVLDLAIALDCSTTSTKLYILDMERRGLWRWARAKGGYRKLFRRTEPEDPTPTPANRAEWQRRKEIMDEVRAEMFACPNTAFDLTEYHRRLDARLDEKGCDRRRLARSSEDVA